MVADQVDVAGMMVILRRMERLVYLSTLQVITGTKACASKVFGGGQSAAINAMFSAGMVVTPSHKQHTMMACLRTRLFSNPTRA